jgi:hypothetical protein
LSCTDSEACQTSIDSGIPETSLSCSTNIFEKDDLLKIERRKTASIPKNGTGIHYAMLHAISSKDEEKKQ